MSIIRLGSIGEIKINHSLNPVLFSFEITFIQNDYFFAYAHEFVKMVSQTFMKFERFLLQINIEPWTADFYLCQKIVGYFHILSKINFENIIFFITNNFFKQK